MSDQKTTIASILKELRKANNLTQDEVAAKLGIARGSYLTYENGRNNIPFETAINFARICNVPLDVLAGYKDVNVFMKQKKAVSADAELSTQIETLQDIEELRAIATYLHEDHAKIAQDYDELQQTLRTLADRYSK